jgi:hypothetical protein
MHTLGQQSVARCSKPGLQTDSESSCGKGGDVDLSCQANRPAQMSGNDLHRRGLTYQQAFVALAFMATRDYKNATNAQPIDYKAFSVRDIK